MNSKYKKSIFLGFSFLALLILSSCAHLCEVVGHNYSEATCISIPTCSECGDIQGSSLGHNWAKATCTTASICEQCGEERGQPLSPTMGHDWVDSTCTAPKTCSVCGQVEGWAEDHQFSNIGVCDICEATKGLGNSYGYFFESEIYEMAKHAIEQYLYPAYLNNYASSGEIVLEEADTSLYGADSFVVVFNADVTDNGSTHTKFYAVVVTPTSETTYIKVDIFEY